MLIIKRTVGNIFTDDTFSYLKNTDYDKIKITRTVLEKKVFRVTSSRGVDIGFELEHGVKLHHGDIIDNKVNKIIIQQVPEKVLTVKIKNSNQFYIFILIGHIIGNRHRPISINNSNVSFPIQVDSEKDVFVKLFGSMIKHVDLVIERKIFLPHLGADVHEH